MTFIKGHDAYDNRGSKFAGNFAYTNFWFENIARHNLQFNVESAIYSETNFTATKGRYHFFELKRAFVLL